MNKDYVFIAYMVHFMQAAHSSQLLFKNFMGIGCLCFLVYLLYAGLLEFPEFPEQIVGNIIYFIILLYSI